MILALQTAGIFLGLDACYGIYYRRWLRRREANGHSRSPLPAIWGPLYLALPFWLEPGPTGPARLSLGWFLSSALMALSLFLMHLLLVYGLRDVNLLWTAFVGSLRTAKRKDGKS